MRQPKTWLFLGVMLCQFALFEAGLRLKGGSEAAPAFQRLFMNDDKVGYRLKPGARTRYKTASFETDIAINSSGVRDEELGPKQPNEKRIVVLGDSLVLSVQVGLQQTFCKRLEAFLNQDLPSSPYHYRVINAGVQGYGPVEDLLFYEHVASALDADVVVLTLFVGNDAMEAADSASRLEGGNGAPTRTNTVHSLGIPQRAVNWMRRVVRRSIVLQIVRLRVLTLMDRFRGPKVPPIERPLKVYLPKPSPDVTRGLEVTRECVVRLSQMASANEAKTAVLLMPARLQVNDNDFNALSDIVEQNGETLVRNAATDRFKEALARLPVPVLDLLPALYDAPRRSETFFEDTVHLTPRGHAIVAREIESFLLDSGLIAAPATRRAGASGR